MNAYRCSVAPMMGRTDRHHRHLMRAISRRTLLYTEMITSSALEHGDLSRLLTPTEGEHPVALQLGGSDPAALARCAKLAEDHGYDEVDLNVGCPSDRVVGGTFGAVLMRNPGRVAECVAAMRAACQLPVTVKHRIGVDELDRYEDLARFVEIVAQARPTRLSVHARKAWLKGLSPKENRTTPPLRYQDVYRLKAERPELCVVINGGIRDLDSALDHLARVDGVMIGRAAWDHPYLFAEADARLFGDPHPPPTREQVARAFVPYAQARVAEGHTVAHVLRVLLNLFAHQPGARAWKRSLTHSVQQGRSAEDCVEAGLAVVAMAREQARVRGARVSG